MKLLHFGSLVIGISITYMVVVFKLIHIDSSTTKSRVAEETANTASHALRIDSKIQGLNPDSGEILVLGMHHSGTSIITMFLDLMGVHSGGKSRLLMRKDNPMKYWELKRAVEIDQGLFNAYDIERGYSWLGYGFNLNKIPSSAVVGAKHEISTVIQEMNTEIGRPWVIKDPRMSLTASIWLEQLSNPVCLLVVRNPVESAFRFLGYNNIHTKFSVKEWISAWEEYTVRSIESCVQHSARIVLVRHSALGSNPFETLEKMNMDLFPNGKTGIKGLNIVEIFRILGKSFVARHVEKQEMIEPYLPSLESVGSAQANEIWQALMAFEEGDPYQLYSLTFKKAWVPLSVNSYEAYVTYVRDDSDVTLTKMMVLAMMILRYDSSRELVALLGNSIGDKKMVKELGKMGWKAIPFKDTQKYSTPCMSRKQFMMELATSLQQPKLLYININSITKAPLDSMFRGISNAYLLDGDEISIGMATSQTHQVSAFDEGSCLEHENHMLQGIAAGKFRQLFQSNQIFSYASQVLCHPVEATHSEQCNLEPAGYWNMLVTVAGRTSDYKVKGTRQ